MGEQYIFFLLIALVFLVRKLPLRYPFKWQETFWHEFSHGLAAMLTLGSIVKIQLRFDGSGVCYTRGGSRTIILFAGYLGAALWGGLLYTAGWVSNHELASGWLMGMIGVLVITTLFFVRDIVTLIIMSIMIGTLVGAMYLPVWTPLPPELNPLPYFLQFSGLYVLISAIVAPTHLLDGKDHGDGAELAKKWFIPEIVWILLWISIGLCVLYWCWTLAWYGAV